MPAEFVLEAAAAARTGKPLYSLDVEFDALPISAARKLGLPDAWVAKLERNPAHRQVLAVARRRRHAAAGVLKEGDLPLAVDGRTPIAFVKWNWRHRSRRST